MLASGKALYPTDEDFKSAAWVLHLGTDVAAIQAVAKIESGPLGAFLPTGEPVILFERHLFHEFTDGKFDGAKAPDLPDDCAVISSPEPGGYGHYSQQHARLQAAVALDHDAALRAASWGLFQILGDNWKACHYEDLQRFINAMYRSVQDHLLAFTQFIRSSNTLVDALRSHDWASFALRYNGPGYRSNQYDTDLAMAYKNLISEQQEADDALA